MKKIDYLKYALNNNLIKDANWYITFFSIIDYSELKDTYLKSVDGIVMVRVDEDWVPLEDVKTGEPIYLNKDKIKIDNTWISNCSKEIDTTIGRLIANKILLEINFGNKIEYANFQFTIKTLEGRIGPLLRNKVITIEEYLKFTDSCAFITNFARIVSVSATPISVTRSPDMAKKKKELRGEMEKKYGKNWTKDKNLVAEYQSKLEAIDNDYIKNDPSYGKLMSGKILNNSRPKMFITWGGEKGFDSSGSNITMIDNDLTDGYPKDKDQLAAMWNASRAGSFGRGKETQKGGAAAKDILRSTSSVKIAKGDCGTVDGLLIDVTEDIHKSLFGRYLMNGTKIEDTKQYIGKKIKIRSPMYCLTKGSDFCSICAGDYLASNPSSISLSLLDVSSTLLKLSLKSMHQSNKVKTVVIDITKVLE